MIRVEGLKKRFGPKVVLDGVDLAVERGESLVVIGGSGTGKSVLIKCILGLLDPDGGRILLDGHDTTCLSQAERKPFMRRIGMLFQGAALFDSLPVWENVAFGLIQAHGVKRREARRIAIEKLARVGLREDVADLYPAELSGGMKKRVGLARAIAATPEIIFFDEPTTGLDPIMAGVIDELIVEQVEDLGATTITITHDMKSARRIADRIAMLHQGRIIWQGTVEEVDSTDNPYVRQFVAGSPQGPIRMALRADEST
ncbi:MAG: ABC transporter ATP-binding protein [Alphaproteobacteria bacterium]|nr:MAG: ABC transporter ATP-binding protein [Alphaproteobacteria bacterium]